MNRPENFIGQYAAALQTQTWSAVAPLLHDSVTVTFSDGVVHRGIEAVQAAYERNFRLIQNEDYRISEVQWIYRSETIAIYVFNFQWSGFVAGKPAGGQGCGTAVLVWEQDSWKLLAEHLGRK